MIGLAPGRRLSAAFGMVAAGGDPRMFHPFFPGGLGPLLVPILRPPFVAFDLAFLALLKFPVRIEWVLILHVLVPPF